MGLGAAAGIASNMASTRAPQRPLAQLVDVVSGESHSITSAQVTIGRERSLSDIALRDPNVSRRHAQLTFTGSDWSIEDLNSTNGTLGQQPPHYALPAAQRRFADVWPEHL